MFTMPGHKVGLGVTVLVGVDVDVSVAVAVLLGVGVDVEVEFGEAGLEGGCESGVKVSVMIVSGGGGL